MTNNSNGTLYIGTSNVVLPGNKSTFPEAFKVKSRLNYYSILFKSEEVNSSFTKYPCIPLVKSGWLMLVMISGLRLSYIKILRMLNNSSIMQQLLEFFKKD